jgi:hypothetical protein
VSNVDDALDRLQKYIKTNGLYFELNPEDALATVRSELERLRRHPVRHSGLRFPTAEDADDRVLRELDEIERNRTDPPDGGGAK